MGSLARRVGEASSVDNCRNRLDLHELVVVPEHGDAEERARHVVLAECLPDNLPCRHQVGLAS